VPLSVFGADRRCPCAPPSLSSRRRELFHGERSPSPLLPLFLPWKVEPSSLALHPDAGPPPATGALTSSENATADPVSPPPPPRRQGALVSYRLHPHARRVASPTWVLEHHLLLHLRHCSAVAGRAGRGQPVKPWATRVVQTGRAGAVDVGYALLCNWAERGFGPMVVELVFYFPNIFKSLQI
jgi:hypothetical protein